ncbi:hypothetical protein C8R45DRAFT_434229 [Mycena sanguinolenta]|nr:hypothetical protein C8R45DRAFT_434229 [Mycena sanguinolenta]
MGKPTTTTAPTMSKTDSTTVATTKTDKETRLVVGGYKGKAVRSWHQLPAEVIRLMATHHLTLASAPVHMGTRSLCPCALRAFTRGILSLSCSCGCLRCAISLALDTSLFFAARRRCGRPLSGVPCSRVE